ncbi:MAG TPA: D-glycero-beta-D-manno-heptose-7-phosphate kinase [Methylophilaceae bacterium]|nr:D-glycero-beta-D-manno-heptose-7-phosphate kinase [Methylophilaceae bacterium]
MSQQKLIDTVREQFGQRGPWVLVIGDLMLDRYLVGDVQRISPEAPVPVVLLRQHHERAGGAANVAANLAGLGIETRMAGCIGDDAEGRALLQMLAGDDIRSDAVFVSSHRPTVTKTRILGGHQQMLRLDQESAAAFSEDETRALQALLSRQLQDRPAMVILSDYAKGVLGSAICRDIIGQASQLGIPVLVDPKGRDYGKYEGATALTPNKRETAEACGASMDDHTALLSGAKKLRDALGLEFLAVTRGEEGISLIDGNNILHIPATAKQVFDVSGAGDTVISTLAAGMIHGLNHVEALQLANIAAGIVVGKVGTVPISREELLHELISQSSAVQADKICDLPSLLTRVAAWKAAGQRIVFTNGCFDLLHAGHVTYLEAARKTGDRLILGLNTDRSVSALKGPTRPVIHEADRARVLAALEAVDAVILFDEDTPLQLIETVRPDVIVKGSDYTEDQVVGGQQVKSWGGKVALIPIVPGRSTSGILEKIAH